MPSRRNISPRPSLSLGKYRHYKGGEYEVVCLACDEETLEWLVVYKALYDTGDNPSIWVRTYEVFTEDIEVDGEKVKRFQLV